MNALFFQAPAFNADISAWNTSSVTDLQSMFYGATAFNADISGWDTSSVTNMNNMFAGAIVFNADISAWDTSSVTSMSSMFEWATAWLDAYSRKDGSSSTDGPPSAWVRTFTGRNDLKAAVDECLSNDATGQSCNMNSWDVSSVTSMTYLFYNGGQLVFNVDISGWNTSSVTNMNSMFGGARSFNVDIRGWDTGSVTNTGGMFNGATAWLETYIRVDGSYSTDGPPSAWTPTYCLPSQDWQYHCGPEPYIGSLTCPVAQLSCGGCTDGSTGSTYDQCNQCLSVGHRGLDGVATCDGSCTPGDVSDPCFKGFTSPPPPAVDTSAPAPSTSSPPPPTVNTSAPAPSTSTTPPPPPSRPSLVFDDDESESTRRTGMVSALALVVASAVLFL